MRTKNRNLKQEKIVNLFRIMMLTFLEREMYLYQGNNPFSAPRWIPMLAPSSRLLSPSRRQSAAIAQKRLKVKTRDSYLSEKQKITRIGSVAAELQRFKDLAFYPQKPI